MAHKFEYRFIQKWIIEKSIAQIPNYSIKDAQKALAVQLDITAEELPPAISEISGGGDWEVNSHSYAFIGNTILISILLQRSVS